ncbi:hypothetical protein D3C75_1103790 [compost metagenome]
MAGDGRVPVVRQVRLEKRRVGMLALARRKHHISVQRRLSEIGDRLGPVVMGQRLGLHAVNTAHWLQLTGVALVDLERGQQVQGTGQIIGRGL